MLTTVPRLRIVSPPDTDEVVTEATPKPYLAPIEPHISEWSDRPNILAEARDLGVEALYGVLDTPGHLLPVAKEAASNFVLDAIGNGILVFGHGDRLVRGTVSNIASKAVTLIGLGYKNEI